MRRWLAKSFNRWLGLGLLALVLLVGLLVFGAPASSTLESGSTWSRSPAGYSAWYESLQAQGVMVQRWQRPVPDLIKQLDGKEIEGITTTWLKPQVKPVSTAGFASKSVPATTQETPVLATLVVVLPDFAGPEDLFALLPWLSTWLETTKHRLVLLGLKEPATAAPFTQSVDSDFGPISIATRRRHDSTSDQKTLLEDDFGALVWQSSQTAGEVILTATPHLAANAYLNQPGNFALLTELVTQGGGPVWIDEYLHGYREEGAIAAEDGPDTWLSYLSRTPLLVFAAQAMGITLLAILTLNRRLGQRQTVPVPAVDNSQAYITAMAGVLHKAGSYDFVVQTLGQAERAQLQKALGLGAAPVTDEQLQTDWIRQTGGTASDLAPVLQPSLPVPGAQLKDWLKRLQSVQQLTQENKAGHE